MEQKEEFGAQKSGIVSAKIEDRKFGWILPTEGGEERWFHYTALVEISFEDLRPGDQVTYIDLPNGPKGPRAVSVKKVANGK